nr:MULTISPECIES: RHS repeat-associated core domain-containing protein [unclassified Pseudomonas]
MAKVVSRESYHPFGTTALWERGDSSEESYRTLGYVGKECDATGLYYFKRRYYLPWQQRWLSPDPELMIDGPNLYRMVGNNPVNLIDDDGLKGKRAQDEQSSASSSKRPRLDNQAGPSSQVTSVPPRVRARHPDSEGESESEDPDIFYRALRKDETRLKLRGLRPPIGHDKFTSSYEHVRRGTRALLKSRWISGTRSLKVAGIWAAEGSKRVVKFRRPAESTTFDLTTEQGRAAMQQEHADAPGSKPIGGELNMVMNFAKGSQEVLIDSYVEPEAILEVYEATLISEKERLEWVKNNPGPSAEQKVIRTRSTVDSPHKSVLLKRINPA